MKIFKIFRYYSMVKYILCVIMYIAALCTSVTVSAQNVITGKLSDKTGDNIDGAAVVVMKAVDSTSLA